MNERLIFTLQPFLIMGQLTSSAFGDGNPEKRRMPPHGQPLLPRSATTTAVWRCWQVHREACLMFCFTQSDFFEDHQPLKPFRSHGIKVASYGYYYPSRYADLLNDEQRAFCRSLYQFKEGEIHGIEFFKACMSTVQLDDAPCHVMFMPCSNEFKYARRFKRLHWYISKHRPRLTSGLYDVDVFEQRESLHEAKGGENHILERNYRITGNI